MGRAPQGAERAQPGTGALTLRWRSISSASRSNGVWTRRHSALSWPAVPATRAGVRLQGPPRLGTGGCLAGWRGTWRRAGPARPRCRVRRPRPPRRRPHSGTTPVHRDVAECVEGRLGRPCVLLAVEEPERVLDEVALDDRPRPVAAGRAATSRAASRRHVHRSWRASRLRGRA